MKGAKALDNSLRNSTIDQFFQVRPEKQDTWGKRYFRYNCLDQNVVEIAIIPGDAVKSGKHSCIGIFVIGRLTFLSNYLAMNYVEIITKEIWEEKFKEAINILA